MFPGGCDGIEVTALLISGILAFPSTWSEKSKGLFYGILVLTVLNLLRLPVLYLVGANGSKELFEFFHVQGGFIVFIGITVFIWCYWILQVLNKRNQNQKITVES